MVLETKNSKQFKKKASSKPLVCWDHGKQGHTRNHCKVKRKINILSISDEGKQRLLELLNDEDDFELELLELEDSESSNWTTKNDSDKEIDCKCNHNNTIMDLNSLSMNMIST